jgi:tetratricopeptide (TPR) repeat protein
LVVLSTASSYYWQASIMSGEKSELEQRHLSDADDVCACCGIAGVDNIKLKICDGGCDLVKYCGDDCRENHRPQHEDECKKRLAELHEKELFTQNDISYLGECPICCLPLSLHLRKSIMMTCCCKYICIGCDHANQLRENDQGLEHRCAFCREPISKSQEERDKRKMKRIKQNDPVAMRSMGKKHSVENDYGKALEYYIKAAELGDADAHACLGDLYREGKGVEKDKEKAVYHLEQAAIGGHPTARVLLWVHEEENGSFERAAKHLIIAANLGHDLSLQAIKDLFIDGEVSKEVYAAALRGHQAAVDATKSAEREKAEEAGA